MSLWSPVDLVTGGSGTKNSTVTNSNTVNSSQFRIVEEVLEHLYAKPSPSNVSPFSSDNNEEIKSEYKSPFRNNTTSLLYDHLIRRGSSKSSDSNNVLSKNVNSQINCNLKSNSCNEEIVQQNLEISKGFNKNDRFDALSKRLNKRSRIKELIDFRHHPVINSTPANLPANLLRNSHQLHHIYHSLPALKSKKSNEVICDKRKESECANVKMNNNDDNDTPLNLCIKKPKAENPQSTFNSTNLHNNNIFSKVVSPQSNTVTSNTINAHHHHQTHDVRKGRKSKSILATNKCATPLVNSEIDTKPRKRGRPPTLSPPLSTHIQPPLSAHSSFLNKLLSSTSSSSYGAFHQFPFLNASLPHGVWPSLGTSEQLFFHDKINGNEFSNDNKKRKLLNINSSDQNASGNSDINESTASDFESDDDKGSDESDLDSQSSENKSDGHGNRSLPDEKEIRIPLEHGWRRLTKIKSFSRSGVRGEVIYFGPCGKKLNDYSEVNRYLAKNDINDIRKENFSFNPKINVGEFVERVHDDGTEILLSESEVIARIEESKLRRRNSGVKGTRNERRKRVNSDAILFRDFEESHGKDNHAKSLAERTRVMIPRDAKRSRYEEILRIKDHDILMKEHEKYEKMEMIRLGKIAKTQQIEEARRKRREELERQRQEEIIRKTKERELKRQQTELLREQEMQKRRELLIMADLERERRRQHMMLVRALEAHKKQEERERKREELIAEKKAIHERKLQKRRLELEWLRELKKPVDDMMLKDLQSLPTLNRIPGLKLPGSVFADTLMVYEFLHNFGDTLGFDMGSLPSLNTLMLALLNLDDGADDELLSIMHHLLVCAIEDPGIPTNVVTVMGQKLKDAPITNYNITEILRLYFLAFDCNIRAESKDQRLESRMVKVLSRAKHFLALNASQKASILAFLCNELLCNQMIVKRIDESIETAANLRRDKWIHENDLRKWRTVKLKREKICEQQQEESKKNDVEEGDEESGESDDEDKAMSNNAMNDTEEEPGLTNEEIDKKIDKLNKQCNQMNNKLNKATNMFRVVSLGQDRYRRRYWILPNAGGVFVEGLESGEPEEQQNNMWNDEELESSNDDDKQVKVKSEESDQKSVKIEDNENNNEQNDAGMNSGEIQCKTEESDKCEKESENNESSEEIDKCDTKIDNDVNVKNIEEITVNVNDKPKCEEKIKEETAPSEEPKKDKSPQQSTNPNDNQWMSPFFASMLAGSMMMGNNTNNVPQFTFPFPFGLDFANSSTPKPNNSQAKGWFNILPRTPCDEKTITETPNKTNGIEISSEIHDSKHKNASKLNDLLFNKQKNDHQQTLSSLMNGLPSNLFMQAFLYPHILNSLFNQQSLGGGGPCPPDTSPFSLGQSSLIGNTSYSSLANSTSNVESTSEETPVKQSADDISIDKLSQPIDADLCPSLQKRILQQREEQYESPQKIPLEYQFGWWRITDPSQLRSMIEVLHNRGLREKQLQKHLQKYLNYASHSCKSTAVEFEITDLDRAIAENCTFGAPKENNCIHETCDDWCKEAALRFDILVLEQIEALEEKIATSSMQIRNWKPPPRISNNDTVKFIPAACCLIENSDSRDLIKYDTKGQEDSDNETDNLIVKESHHSPCNSKKIFTINESGETNPVAVGKDRLLALEAVIERRYLKPPLGFKSNTILISTNTDLEQIDEFTDIAADENATSGLLRWREAVREAQSNAEIALCLHFLETCIAWDKSIMRASCQFCGSGENEAQLLLCDGCDKGYHTYCFKPKMESIPDGDWFCFECQNKNTIDKVCVVCGKKGKLLNCDSCAKVFHPNCLDPPVTKPLKGKWTCHMCGRKPKKTTNVQKSHQRKFSIPMNEEKQKEVSSTSSNSANLGLLKENGKKVNNSGSKTEKATKKERKSKENRCDLTMCRTILNEMEKHEYSWPFLLPVNTKQFPTYKKIIKKPMDTNTIRSKLDTGIYKSRDEFVADIRLIFDNCETFNEDESPVGQAGHNLRAFFETKWRELCDN